MSNMITKLLGWIRAIVIRRLNAVSRAQYDREGARLGAIIENHMADSAWLLRKLGIDDHYKFRNRSLLVDREKVGNSCVH